MFGREIRSWRPRSPDSSFVLAVAGLLLVALTLPGVERLYRYVEPLPPAIVLPTIRNLDQVAEERDDPSVPRVVVATPDRPISPPTRLGLPYRHDLAIAAAGRAGIALGQVARRRRKPAPRSGQTGAVVGLWDLGETLALLALALPVLRGGTTALRPILSGHPPNWDAADRAINPILQAAVALFTGAAP